jgi:hypothetical protein
MRGELEFGVITQSAMAFRTLVAAFFERGTRLRAVGEAFARFRVGGGNRMWSLCRHNRNGACKENVTGVSYVAA